MKNLTLAVALLGIFAFAASAADVTGKWTAEMPGRNGDTMTSTFDLKADGDKLTGTVSNPRGEAPISEGKIAGNDLSFKQTMNFNGNEMVILYTGKVDGDKINFTRERQGGQGRKVEFVAKRSTT